MQRTFFKSLIILLAGTLIAAGLQASAVTDAQDRILARTPQIDNLKTSGAVGEDSNGYLAVRTQLSGRQSALVDSENKDRKLLYEVAAKRTGQSVADAGKQRGLQNFSRARAGVWLKKASGEWYQKE
ncbi:MAG: YdbL family protein [Puniceicoccaceae bacterium]